MEKFSGKYQIVKSEHYAEYLAGLGVIKDKSAAPKDEKSSQEFIVNGNKLVIKSSAHDYAPTLVLNEEVDEKTTDGITVKTLLKLDGDNLVVSSTLGDGTVAKRVYSLSGSELTTKYSSNKAGVPEATLTLKKL